jgi:hypothetical protein
MGEKTATATKAKSKKKKGQTQDVGFSRCLFYFVLARRARPLLPFAICRRLAPSLYAISLSLSRLSNCWDSTSLTHTHTRARHKPCDSALLSLSAPTSVQLVPLAGPNPNKLKTKKKKRGSSRSRCLRNHSINQSINQSINTTQKKKSK